ncbi:MAG: bifunctional UDP-sugar hydrolase/5'-nucleotidase [Verrucomicrobiota bacterium]
MRTRIALVVWMLLCVVAAAREVPITILHTCDLHGNILPTDNYDGQTNLGGFARCATVIRQVRTEQPNTLVVDAGDTLQGAAVSYLSDGRVMVQLLNLLQYDAWVWGNHEFDWGLDKLTANAELANVPILNANVQRDGNAAARLFACVKPYRILTVDGVKVGFIGLNTPGIPSWSRPQLIAGLKFVDSIATLKSVMPEIRRAGAQVLVLVVHQGYRESGDDHASQVSAIAGAFPELDVIVGAHTHRNLPEFKINGVLNTQADYYGIHLGRVDLVYDTTAGKVTRRESRTVSMDDHVPLDPVVLAECRAELDNADRTLRTVIGEATGEFDVRNAPKHETPMHNLIFESIVAGLGARGIKVDAVVHGVLERRGVLKTGPVTIGDVWRAVPYENKLGVCQLTAVELREILDEDAGAYNGPTFRGVWGLHWEFDPKLPAGQRVRKLTRADGAAIGDSERLAVAFNSYDLAGGGMRWPKLREVVTEIGDRLVETDVQTRQSVLDYIRQQGKISPTTRGWWKAVNDSVR